MKWHKVVKGDSFISRGPKGWSLGASYSKTYDPMCNDRLYEGLEKVGESQSSRGGQVENGGEEEDLYKWETRQR